MVHVPAGERNFHFFYQLVSGASAEERASLQLGDRTASDFRYLSHHQQGGHDAELSCIVGVDDAVGYVRTMEAMAALGFTRTERGEVTRLVAAILHLGDVQFVAARDGSEVAPAAAAAAVAAAASLLGVPAASLRTALTVKTMPPSGRRVSTYHIPLTPEQATHTRDVLAKALYHSLFRWLVDRASARMAPPPPPPPSTDSDATGGDVEMTHSDDVDNSHNHIGGGSIGVLDIFGFEAMPVNSFEQLCINWANESLHQHFVKRVFTDELRTYTDEGLPPPAVTFTDNAGCVQLLEGRRGVLGALAEQCSLGMRGTDRGFLASLAAAVSSTPPAAAAAAGVSSHAAPPARYWAQPRFSSDTQARRTAALAVEFARVCGGGMGLVI